MKMKKKYFVGMALIASLAFSSCDNEVIYVQGDGNGQTEDVQLITLQVDNGGDGLTTRAGRPLYSSEAKQTIDKVRLWICDNNGSDNQGKVVLVKDFDNWMGTNGDGVTDASSSDYANGRQAELKLTGDYKLANGNYKVYALGYHSTSDYTDVSLQAITNLQVGSKYTENTVLALKSEATNAEEIFAGSAEFTISDEALKQTVVLNRQVAGAYIYVKDIPYYADAKYLKLVASTGNNSLVLGNFASVDIANNGNNTSTNVVNGTSAKSGEYVISEIDLTQWFGTLADSDGDGLVDNTNWTNAIDKADEGSKTTTFEKGSVFGGAFVIPFQKGSAQTLKLVLSTKSGAAEDGSSVKMSWNINLPTKDLATSLTAWNGGAFAAVSPYSETQNVYSILRNHLYSVGKRNLDNPGSGTDPEPKPNEPTPDPTPDDDPESLNNKKVLTLIVNDNWEVIHDMELD